MGSRIRVALHWWSKEGVHRNSPMFKTAGVETLNQMKPIPAQGDREKGKGGGKIYKEEQGKWKSSAKRKKGTRGAKKNVNAS